MDIVQSSKFNEVFLVKPDIYQDSRGYFFESYSQSKYPFLKGINFVQHNESLSIQSNVLRGFHYQSGNSAQAKLVRVVQGKIQDVIVDLRHTSATYGQWESYELSGEDKNLLFIPRGFAHAFLTLTPNVIFHYLCDNYYDKLSENGIIWNDSDLNIPWQVSKNPHLSEKDLLLPSFKQYQLNPVF